MNIILFIFCGLTLAYCSVIITETECQDELREIKSSFYNCFPSDYDLSAVFIRVFEYSDSDLNLDEFTRFVTKFCGTLDSSQHCVQRITPRNETCDDDITIQTFRNFHRSVFYINSYMCENGGHSFRDLIERDGVSCLHNHFNSECIEDAKLDRGLVDSNTFYMDEHICALINTDLDCIYKYEDCGNKKIKTILVAMYDRIKNHFKCVT